MRETDRFRERFEAIFHEASFDDFLASQNLKNTFVEELVVTACAEYLNLNLHVVDIAGTIQLNTRDTSELRNVTYIARTERPNHYMAVADLI